MFDYFQIDYRYQNVSKFKHNLDGVLSVMLKKVSMVQNLVH